MLRHALITPTNTQLTGQNSTIQLELARAANAILCAEDSTVAGVVVTHGTDTLDETAFFREPYSL